MNVIKANQVSPPARRSRRLRGLGLATAGKEILNFGKKRDDSKEPGLREKSGRGQPHSKTWRTVQRSGISRSVLECGCPLPLSIFVHRQAPAASARAVGALLVLALLHPGVASACSVCYGEPDSPATRGLSWAIMALAGIVMMVLAGAVAFFVQAARKSNLVQAADDATSLIEKS